MVHLGEQVDAGPVLPVPAGHIHRFYRWRGLGLPGGPRGQNEGTSQGHTNQVQGTLTHPSQGQGTLTHPSPGPTRGA